MPRLNETDRCRAVGIMVYVIMILPEYLLCTKIRTYTSRSRTGYVFFSRTSPGFISTAAAVVLECNVVLVNVSMTVVWFKDAHSLEVVSWCGVASHPMVEQLLWLWTAHLHASDAVMKSSGLTPFHLCSNVTPRCDRITLAVDVTWHVTCAFSPGIFQHTCRIN